MANNIIPDSVRDVLHYDPLSGTLTWKAGRCAGAVAGSVENTGYLRVRYKGIKYQAHRICWFLHHGTQPDVIDHINRTRSDNRLANLRDVDSSANRLNSKSKGVYWAKPYPPSYFKGAWRASFRGKRLYSGKSILMANFHRIMAERAHHLIGLPPA